MLPLTLQTPKEIALELAQRVKALRLDREWTQEELAGRAGIALATYQRFERTGRISLERLLKLAVVLDARRGFHGLFSGPELQSMDDPLRLTPLDRLAYVGSRAVGALAYHPPSDEGEGVVPLELGEVAEQAERIVRGSQEEVLPALFLAGGSPGGARPKVLVGLLHASHRIPSVEYDAFLRVTLELTKDHRQLLEAFRRMAFNVLAHVRDDHTKNFSFLMDRKGQWTLAPAYDLVFSHGISGWHTMAVAGEALNPGVEEILEVGASCGVEGRTAREIVDQVREGVLKVDQDPFLPFYSKRE